LNVAGVISASSGTGGDENGVDAPTGSGGGIWITASQVTGSGTIRANSNRRTGGFTDRWSGSGGRIAIYYDTMTFLDTQIEARPVSGFALPGAAGTIYLKDNAQAYPDLIIDNGGLTGTISETPIRTVQTTLRSVRVRNQGSMLLLPADVATLTVEQPLNVTSSSLRLGPGAIMAVTNSSGFDLQILTGVLRLDTGSILNANALRVNGSTLTANTDLSFPNGSDFELSGNGTVNIGAGRVFSIGFFDATNVTLVRSSFPLRAVSTLPPTPPLSAVLAIPSRCPRMALSALPISLECWRSSRVGW
jgi:hypothetical protein